jgi:4-diphosphocytidyl-2-C-methyl-D-erythritol kinase
MRKTSINCQKAYAKVNLHLAVMRRRSDGYHDLLSVMAAVGLHDLLKLYEYELVDDEPGKVNVTLTVEGGTYASVLENVPVEKNLITKAARQYFLQIGKAARIKVGITKNIPAGGGLGGGSADAAAMLRLLDGCNDNPVGNESLRKIASHVGADVPFCVTGGLAICGGIGDEIEEFAPLNNVVVLLANNGIHVDTATAYRMIDQLRSEGWVSHNVDGMRNELRKACRSSIRDITRLSRNDFESPVFGVHPSIAAVKDEMIRNGAFFSMMTGSGSTVFGLFDSLDSAESTRKRFIDNDIQVELTEFTGLS